MSLRVWIDAARPKTLPAAVVPVLMGTAIAWRDGVFHWPSAFAALLASVLIQIGTNYANDYFDAVKGTDTEERIGPQRATAAGLVSPAAMRAAFIVTFALAALIGAYLVWRGGLPIVWIGLASIASGILYTGGPKPLGYVGLGDVFVLIFFGPVATAGTYYVQGLAWSEVAAIAGLGPGLLAVALLTVNNLRDVDQDRKAGKRTLAVRFGPTFAKWEYVLCWLGAAAVPVALWLVFRAPGWPLIAGGVCLIYTPPVEAVVTWEPGKPLNSALGGTGRLLVAYGVLFSVGWVV